METHVTIEQLRNTLHQRPFRPFVIHLADGFHVEVRHPEYLAISPTGRTILVYGPDDAYSVIDLLLVTRLELAPTTPSASAG
jgi:hypothetical protein